MLDIDTEALNLLLSEVSKRESTNEKNLLDETNAHIEDRVRDFLSQTLRDGMEMKKLPDRRVLYGEKRTHGWHVVDDLILTVYGFVRSYAEGESGIYSYGWYVKVQPDADAVLKAFDANF